MENIAIYGAGGFGQKMLEVLQRIGCKVILFVQSLKSDVKGIQRNFNYFCGRIF